MSKEIAKELRNKLKEIGYNRNMVTVKATDYSVDVIIKNEVVNYLAVKNIVKEYDSRSIIIDFDEDIKENLANNLKDEAERVFNTRDTNNCLSVVYEDNNYKLLYGYEDEQLLVEDKNSNTSYPDMIEKFNVTSTTDIRYCLMRACLRYKIQL